MTPSDLRVWKFDKRDGRVVDFFTLSGGNGCTLYGGLAVADGRLMRGTDCARVDVYDLATRKLSSVPALSWQTVTEAPPSPVRMSE